MAVIVRTGSVLKKLLGGQLETSGEGATVRELFANLGITDNICDQAGKPRRHFNIHVNEGEDVRLGQGLETPLVDGDVVTILSAIAGGADARRRVWLTYPKELVERPLIWEAGKKFNIVTNIRQASVSRDIGLVGLELSGETDDVRQAVDFFILNGVTVEPVEQDVVE